MNPYALRGQGLIITIAGTEYLFPGDGKPADSAPLGQVTGVAASPDGVLYLVDNGNHLVASVGKDGVLHVLGGNGIADITGDGGSARSAGIRFPGQIARDAAGNLYFTDSDRIRRIGADGIITTIAGGGTLTGDGVSAASLRLDSPFGVVVGADGSLYVSDNAANIVYRISSGVARRFAGGGAAQADGGPATSARLIAPAGLAVDSAGGVYIAESGDGAGRIRRVSPGGIISTVAGGGDSDEEGVAATSASLLRPAAVAIDSAGAVYFADESANRVRRVAGGVVRTVAGSGDSRSTGDLGPAVNAGLDDPSSVAVDSAGIVYIGEAGGRRVRRVDTSGIITTLAGRGFFRLSGDGGPAVNATLNAPTRVAVDAAGNLFFNDTDNGRVRRISPAGVVSTVAGGGSSRAENVPASDADVSYPGAIALDRAGNLYIGEYALIRKVSPNGTIATIAGGGDSSAENVPALTASLDLITALALDAPGNLYFAEGPQNRVRRLGTDGRISTVAGTGQAGSAGDGGPARQARLNEPRGLAADAAGNLFIAEHGGNRVRRVTPSGVISTFAGGGNGAGTGVPATTVALEGPESLAVDSAGNLYIADSGFSLIRRVTPAGMLSNAAGNGMYEFSGDGGPALLASLNGPTGIAVDTAGNLFIADTSNHRIREVLTTQPRYLAAPASLSFSAQAGGAATAEQTVSLDSQVPLAFTATASGGAWLSVSPSTGAMPAVLRISVDPAALAAGSYQATLTINAPNATSPVSRVTVNLTVAAPGNADPAVEPAGLQFAFFPGDPPSSRQVRVLNRGGGSVRFSASADGPGLSLTQASGSASAAAPGIVTVSIDPTGLAAGTYRGALAVITENPARRFDVPITFTVARAPQTMLLSQTGLSFTAVQAGGPAPPQTSAVLNLGRGAMAWTATASSLDPGLSWLSVSPSSGVSVAASLEVPFLEVAVDPAGLGPGEYFGRVQINASGADNSPQFISVVLRVLPAGSNPGPLVRPTGFLFIGEEGSSPGSQDLTVANLTAASVNYITGRTPEPPNALFSAAPSQGAIPAGRPTRLLVQPNFRNLPAGVRQGTLTLDFSDGSFQTVRVLLVVVPRGAGATSSSGVRSLAACAPVSLHGEFTQLPKGFPAIVGYPQPIEVRIADNCGRLLTSGSVVASFSNGDPSLPLAHIQDGRWSRTWTPGRAPSDSVIVRVSARSQDPPVSGEVTIDGSVRANTNAPFVEEAGVVSTAGGVPYAPLAQGGLVSIYGTGLAGGAQSLDRTPAPTQILDTQVVLQGRLLPLLYVSAGQINAIVPFAVAADSHPQLVVQRGSRASVPVTLTVAAAQPLVFVHPTLGPLIANTQGAIVSRDSPVRAGDAIVIYCQGLGPVSPDVPEGSASPAEPLASASNPVSVLIGGQAATVLFAGLTPGFVGLYQVNAVVPAGVAPGDAVPLVVTAAGQSSAPVTIPVTFGQ